MFRGGHRHWHGDRMPDTDLKPDLRSKGAKDHTTDKKESSYIQYSIIVWCFSSCMHFFWMDCRTRWWVENDAWLGVANYRFDFQDANCIDEKTKGFLGWMPYLHVWARICKHFWCPGIDSEESIPQAGNRFLGSFKSLQIRALELGFLIGPFDKKTCLELLLLDKFIWSWTLKA